MKSSIMYLSPVAYPVSCIQATFVRTHYEDKWQPSDVPLQRIATSDFLLCKENKFQTSRNKGAHSRKIMWIEEKWSRISFFCCPWLARSPLGVWCSLGLGHGIDLEHLRAGCLALWFVSFVSYSANQYTTVRIHSFAWDEIPISLLMMHHKKLGLNLSWPICS